MTRLEVAIRDARAEDDEAVGELLVRSFVETHARLLPEVTVTERRKQELRAVAQKRQVAKVWVAHLGGELAGTVALWPPGAKGSRAWLPNAAEIRHLAVEPRFHGRGVAGALMDKAEAWGFSCGAEAICLHVRREATGVARLYQSRGYLRDDRGDQDALPEVFLQAWVLPRHAWRPAQGRQRSSL